MAGRQIRWGTVGRVAAVVVAAIAGIASLPALLGSDKPPPVPADVGLAPGPTTAGPAPPAVPVVSAPRHKPAKRPRKRERSLEPRVRSHPRPHHERQRATAPSSGVSPPIYSYIPRPPAAEDFGFER